VHITRSRQDRWLAGVCAGAAARFGLPVGAVRAGVALLAVAAGPPLVVAYLAAWAILPAVDQLHPPPGDTRRDPGVVAEGVATGAVILGLILLLSELSDRAPGEVVAFAFVACVGTVVVWGGKRGRPRPLRIALGLSLVIAGGLGTLAAMSDLRTIGPSAAGAAVVLMGLALMLGPAMVRGARTLSDERRARILSQERADVAAHLHDGVLQTLALIQKRSADGREVRSLARRQERELREWLYGQRATTAPLGLADLLRRELADVEDRYGVRIDAVLVGDWPLDDAGRALVAAGSEAARNAAVHAGVDQVDVYLEVEPERISLFVRDRGRGFDPAAVPPDRRGLADSVVGRIRRHGGVAVVRSSPGEGTEVELSVPALVGTPVAEKGRQP
jgi:signal transduction histidine kinase/phage shock protein PspC (stress-responsive transcriptional regulator)